MVKYEPKTVKADLAKTIAESNNLPMYKAKKIVNDVFEAVFQSLSMGIPVTITNLGSLKPFEDCGTWAFIIREGQAPINKRVIEHEPVMDVQFSAAPRLREAMDNIEARQTSARYSKEARRPRKLNRSHKRKGR